MLFLMILASSIHQPQRLAQIIQLCCIALAKLFNQVVEKGLKYRQTFVRTSHQKLVSESWKVVGFGTEVVHQLIQLHYRIRRYAARWTHLTSGPWLVHSDSWQWSNHATPNTPRNVTPVPSQSLQLRRAHRCGIFDSIVQLPDDLCLLHLSTLVDQLFQAR